MKDMQRPTARLLALFSLLIGASAAIAGMDSATVAAREAGTGGDLPTLALIMGLIGAGWVGIHSFLNDGPGAGVTGAAVGFGVGGMLGFVAQVVLTAMVN